LPNKEDVAGAEVVAGVVLEGKGDWVAAGFAPPKSPVEAGWAVEDGVVAGCVVGAGVEPVGFGPKRPEKAEDPAG
jgi:hypothetical protein